MTSTNATPTSFAAIATGSFLNWRLAACKRSTVVGTKPPSGGFVVFGVSCEPFAAADLSVGRISLRATVFSRDDLHHIEMLLPLRRPPKVGLSHMTPNSVILTGAERSEA